MAAVLVTGGGRIGAHLARILPGAGHRVTVVESDPERADLLSRDFPEVAVVAGSGTDAEVLERAGVRTTDTFVAVTGRDETNLVAVSVARFEFGVPRTIARVVNPKNAWLYGGEFGVDASLNQAEIIAGLVAEELSLGEMVILTKLRRGRMTLVEQPIHGDSPPCGKTVAELELPVSAVLMAVYRGGEYVPAHGSTRLREGDELLAVVHSEEEAALARVFEPSG